MIKKNGKFCSSVVLKYSDNYKCRISAELGDYDPKRHSEGYISEFRFVPNQTEELEQRITSVHRTLM